MPDSTPRDRARIALIREDDPLYDRLEAPGAVNRCSSDAHCMKSGCSAEVCAAESVPTTCEIPAAGWPTEGASCGCVSGACRWYRAPGPSR